MQRAELELAGPTPSAAAGKLEVCRSGAPDQPPSAGLLAAVDPLSARHRRAVAAGGTPARSATSSLLQRAADLLGLAADQAAPAEAAGLIKIGARVRFRHPPVRSGGVPGGEPAGAPGTSVAALAEVTDPHLDPDRRAWHRAHAAAFRRDRGRRAGALGRSRAQPRRQRRGGRLLGARGGTWPTGARRGPSQVRVGGAGGRARLRGACGDVAVGRAPERPAGPPARTVRVRPDSRHRRSVPPGRRRQTARSARSRAGASDLPRGARSGDVRRAPRGRLPFCSRRHAPRPRGRGRRDRSTWCSTDWRGGARRDRPRACRCSGSLETYASESLDRHEEIVRWLLLTPIVQSMTVCELWDDDGFHSLATRAVQLARETGALSMLPVALVYRSGLRSS